MKSGPAGLFEDQMGSRTKNGPSVKSSGRGTGCHVVSERGRAVIYTRGWGPVSSGRIVARCAISDESAYAQKQEHRNGGG